MATDRQSNEPVENRLSAVSQGLESAAAQLQELVAQMRAVLLENKKEIERANEDKEHNGGEN